MLLSVPLSIHPLHPSPHSRGSDLNEFSIVEKNERNRPNTFEYENISEYIGKRKEITLSPRYRIPHAHCPDQT